MFSGRILFLLVVSGLVTVMTVACSTPNPPPATPSGLATTKAKNIDGQIHITWQPNKEEDLAGYRLYRSTNPSGPFTKKIYEGPGTEFLDLDVMGDGQYKINYYYSVAAIDKAKIEGKDVNQESKKSNPVKATTLNLNDPQRVAGVTVHGSHLDGPPSYKISWAPGKEADLKGYHIYRSEKDDAIPYKDESLRITKELILHDKKAKGFNYIDKTDVHAGVRYYYAVFAVDYGGWNSKPQTENITDIVLHRVELNAPKNGEDTTTTPTLKWKAVPNAEGYVVVIQKRKQGSPVHRSQFVKGTEYKVPDKTLETSQTYYWYVYAYSKKPSSNEKDGNSDSDLGNFIAK